MKENPVKVIAGGDVTIRWQFSGNIYLTCSKQSQSDNLLKCVLFGNVAPVVVTEIGNSREPILTKLRKIYPVLLMYNELWLKGTMWRLKQILRF